MPTGKPLSPEQVARAVELDRRLWTHARIADDLGVCRETVQRALARLHKAALKRLERARAAEKARQVARLEWIAEQAIAGWERSLQDSETVKRTKGGGPEGGTPEALGEKTETTTKGQSGDARKLAEARAALADIRTILGLDDPNDAEGQAPQKVLVEYIDRPIDPAALESAEGDP